MSSNTLLAEADEIEMQIHSRAHTHTRVGMTNSGGRRMRIAMKRGELEEKKPPMVFGGLGARLRHAETASECERRHDYRRYGVGSVLSADATEQSRINSQQARDKNLSRATLHRQ